MADEIGSITFILDDSPDEDELNRIGGGIAGATTTVERLADGRTKVAFEFNIAGDPEQDRAETRAAFRKALADAGFIILGDT